MNRFLHGVARAVAETFDLPEPILEIGSYQVDGQETIADLRSLFSGKEYVGLDMRCGPGVDLVADVEDLPLEDSSVGTVIAMSTFEHVPRFWKGFDEVRRVLRPDGVFLVSCPFYFHIHAYPNDYWRFTPEAFALLLEEYGEAIFGWHGPQRRPSNVWALAFGEACPPVRPQQVARHRELLRAYARQPLSWKKALRYRLGRLLFGSRPFAPYLDLERWETKWRTRTPSTRVSKTGRRSVEPARSLHS